MQTSSPRTNGKSSRRKLTVAELAWARIADAQSFVPASRSTFYNWLESGLVRSRRINGARYIDMESLRQFIEGAPSKPSKAVSRRMTKRAFASADKRAARNGVEA